MAERPEVAVVGGGVTGWAIAYVLCQRGVSVTVVERDGIAAHASGMAAGVLNPLDGDNIPGLLQPLALDGFHRHLEWWPRLAEETGIDVQGRRLPLLRVAFGEELDQLEEMDAIEGTDSFTRQRISPADVARLEPDISSQVAGGLIIEGIGSLDSYLFTLALSRAAQKLGAKHIHDTVTGLESSNDASCVLSLARQRLSCQAVILAMGPWSLEAEAWLGHPVPVYPLKGDLLRMATPRLASDLIIHHPDGLLSRKLDGLVWAGTSNEEAGFDHQPSSAAGERIMAGALRVAPTLADARVVRHTSCLRPQTRDGLPLIGPAWGWRNVYLATGAGHKGVLLAPSIAMAVADLITEGRTTAPIDGFGAERFAVGSP